MKTCDELKALIERRGVHPEFGDVGEGWGIEQNPHELATFLVAMQKLGVQSILEIGTGYKGGLSRFLAQDMGWQVTTVDVVDYGHKFEGVEYITDVDRTFANKSYDLVFIDGDHSQESVSCDFMYHQLSAKKAIAFHDILGLRDSDGAREVWQAIVNSPLGLRSGHEVYRSNDPQRAGIGWLTV